MKLITVFVLICFAIEAVHCSRPWYYLNLSPDRGLVMPITDANMVSVPLSAGLAASYCGKFRNRHRTRSGPHVRGTAMGIIRVQSLVSQRSQ